MSRRRRGSPTTASRSRGVQKNRPFRTPNRTPSRCGWRRLEPAGVARVRLDDQLAGDRVPVDDLRDQSEQEDDGAEQDESAVPDERPGATPERRRPVDADQRAEQQDRQVGRPHERHEAEGRSEAESRRRARPLPDREREPEHERRERERERVAEGGIERPVVEEVGAEGDRDQRQHDGAAGEPPQQRECEQGEPDQHVGQARGRGGRLVRPRVAVRPHSVGARDEVADGEERCRQHRLADRELVEQIAPGRRRPDTGQRVHVARERARHRAAHRHVVIEQHGRQVGVVPGPVGADRAFRDQRAAVDPPERREREHEDRGERDEHDRRVRPAAERPPLGADARHPRTPGQPSGSQTRKVVRPGSDSTSRVPS